MKNIGFQGVRGAYSESAAFEFFGGDIETCPCESFEGVFDGVESGALDIGIIPIENSLAGSIRVNYDLLQERNVWIVNEHKFRVEHNLLVMDEAELEDLQEIYSHPQALAQCARFIKSISRSNPVPYFDTAGSALLVAQSGDKSRGAIACKRAAEEYGLKVLLEGVEDNEENYTRFLMIIRNNLSHNKKQRLAAGENLKTSIVFSLKNIPGCLYKCLSIFAIRDIDLLKIESRPLPGSPWQYAFYIDFRGSSLDGPGQKALGHLQEITEFSMVLGTYPEALGGK